MATCTLPRPHSPVPVKSQLCSVGEASRLLGVSSQTVRNALERGELTGYRLASGHRRLSRRAVLELAGEPVEDMEERSLVVIYGRVSTSKQSSLKHKSESDLTRQMDRLRKYAKENHAERELIEISDVGSGLNYTKPGLTKLLNGMLSGEFKGAVIIVENRDRLTRWGCEIYETVAAHASIEIKYIDQQNIDDTEMLSADLLAIMTIFTTRMYSRRSAERRRKQLSDDFVQRATELNQQGLTVRAIAQTLKDENYRDERGEIVSHQVIYNNILKPLDTLKKIIPNSETPVARFIREETEQRPLNYRLKITDFYSYYLDWCRKNNVPSVTVRRLTSNLPNKVRRSGYLKGVIVKGKKLHSTVKVVKEHARTTRLNEKLAEFCKEHGLSFGAAQQKLQTV